MVQNQCVYALTGSYQNVVSPSFLGKVQRCLFELHDILIAPISPVLGSQLARIGPARKTSSRIFTETSLVEHKLPNIQKHLRIVV